jgi:GT2 family glycosyltransferase
VEKFGMRDVIVGTLSKKIDYCENFIRSLVICHPYFDKHNVYVIDDTRLPKDEMLKLKWAKDVTWIPSVRPWGFSKNANFLIQAALIKGVDLLMCNDDTEFMSPNTIYALQQVSNNYPEVGVLSPIFVGVVGNTRQMSIREQYKEGQVIVYEDKLCLCFVAVYFPYNTLEKVGFLNEEFNEESYGWEDTEYCDRVKEAGMKLGITPLVKMRHGRPGKPFSGTYSDMVNFDLMIEKGKMIYSAEKKRRKLLNATSLGRL